MYKDLMAKQQADEEEKKKDRSKPGYFDQLDKSQREPPSVYNPEGEIRQCNQGKYKFKFLDTWEDENLTFELYVPRFLDTSLMKVDLNPLYVRIDIKGKVTQVKFPEEIVVDKSKVQRSTTTGALQLVCPKLNFDPSIKERVARKKATVERERAHETALSTAKAQETKKLAHERIDISHILKKGEKEEELLKVLVVSAKVA